ncbi:hypothetical protein [Mycobacteroides immunogenum]|uniref:hypothetical protein n=1 Tax=Mycobacteroides immunogenum TaxID=83262 RepID=UPI000695D9E3|nr:hypothetical protein [Mycobacteroides immunogenum]ANO03552.1 hypothetical protein BAB75_09280 [Mycobacteroides immunogenum]MCV7306596.1 hypothetical protein [Mycobacteroides immunogenum]ORV77595.1 hypothetical protein AWC10_15670 [Mycobacteroides immunogenum]
MDTEDWDRLADFVGARVEELHLTQAEVQARGGPSPAKVREIINRRARALSPSKRRDLERALAWDVGSIDITLAGGVPTTLESQGARSAEDSTPPTALPDLVALGRAAAGFSDAERQLASVVIQSTLRQQYDENERKIQELTLGQSVKLNSAQALKALVALQRYVEETSNLNADELNQLIKEVRVPLRDLAEDVLARSAGSEEEVERLLDLSRSLLTTSKHLREVFGVGDDQPAAVEHDANLVRLKHGNGDELPPAVDDELTAASEGEKASDLSQATNDDFTR